MSEKVMSLPFALFNLHINDASEKAKKAFIKRFSQEEWDKSIQPFHDKGIMSIFDSITDKTLWYVETIGIYVNENRE